MVGMTGPVTGEALARRRQTGTRGAGRRRPQAEAAEPALAGVIVMAVGVVAVIMAGVCQLRCIDMTAMHIRRMRVHRSAQEQLQEQNGNDDPVSATHGATRYALD